MVTIAVNGGTGGSVDVYKNGSLVATVTTSLEVSYGFGDTYKFVANPSTGYIFKRFCLTSDCSYFTNTNPYSGIVDLTGVPDIYAYFVAQATVQVSLQSGEGTVDVFINGKFIGNTVSGTVKCYVGDTFKFYARPSANYIFQKFCADTSCSVSATSNPFSGTITEKSGYLYIYFQYVQPTWRLGRNYSRTCPACPRTPSYCLNSLEETTQFSVGDTVWAIYETQCVGTSPTSTVNWYKKDITGDWVLYTSWTPPQAYPTAMEVNLTNAEAGCYKVEYYIYSTEFTIGSSCVTVLTNVSPAGTGAIKANGQLVSSSITVSSGAQVTLEAGYAEGWQFDRFEDGAGNIISRQNPFTTTIAASGSITAVFRSSSIPTFRVGKNFVGDCPSCPRVPSYCLNPLNEATTFSTTDNIYVTYDTQCSGYVVDSPLSLYKKDSSGNWALYSSMRSVTPGLTSFNIQLPSLSDGCYKVEYLSYSIQFTVGSGTCPPPVITLSMAVSPSGSGSLTTNNQNVTSAQVNYKDTVIWQATPAQGWQFDHFNLPDGQSTANPVYWLATVSGTTTAVFTQSPQTINLNMSVYPSGSGSLTTNNQNVTSAQVNYKDTVIWQANSSPGWRFDHFNLPDGQSTANPVYWLATVSGTTTAVFVQAPSITLNMSVYPSGSGSLTTNGQNLSSITVPSGSSITFKATASTGWKFDHYNLSNGSSTTSNPLTASFNTSGTITAVFAQNPAINLTMAVSPSGSGTILTNGSNIVSASYNYKDTVIWQANPATGWKFDHFNLPDGQSTANPVYWLATVSGTTTAVFVQTQQPISLSMSVSPSGSGSLTTNGQNVSSTQVNYKSTVIWQANPATGWKFDHFILPDGQSTANPVYWLATMSGTTTAVFVKSTSNISLNMAVSPSGGGTILTNGNSLVSASYAYGSTVVFQANPAIGWQFDHFNLPDGQSSSNPVYWLATVSGTVTAVFIKTVTLNMSVYPSGSGSLTTNGYNVGSTQVNYNSTVVWKATPSTGWRFDHFNLPDGQSTANPVYWLATVSGTTTAVFVK